MIGNRAKSDQAMLAISLNLFLREYISRKSVLGEQMASDKACQITSAGDTLLSEQRVPPIITGGGLLLQVGRRIPGHSRL